MATSSGVVLEMSSDGPPLEAKIEISTFLAEAIEAFFLERIPEVGSLDAEQLASSLANRLQAEIIEGVSAAMVPWADAVLERAYEISKGVPVGNVTP